MRVNKVDLSHHSYMNRLFNRIWWWTGELWWPHSNLMWWMSRRQRVIGLSHNQHCSSWKIEKNKKKQEITFSLLKPIKDRKWKQLSLKRDYWCNGECEWRAMTSTSTTLGCVKKAGKLFNCNFSMFYDSWLFDLLLVQSFSKFSTQGTSVNCGAHKADSCADCPLVWRHLHILDNYWLFIEL